MELHRRNHQLKGLITAAPAWWNCPALLHCDLADKLTSWLFLSPHAIAFSLWHPPCPSIDQRNLGDLRVSSRCGRRSAASADAVNQGRVLGCAAIRDGLIWGVPLEAMVHCCCCRDCMEEWLVTAAVTARRSKRGGPLPQARCYSGPFWWRLIGVASGWNESSLLWPPGGTAWLGSIAARQSATRRCCNGCLSD